MSFERIPAITATITTEAGPVTLKVSGGSIALDSGWSPYARGTVEIPYLDETLLDALNPFQNPRVLVTAGNGTTLTTFNLVLRSRTISHESKTIRLAVASDEALLQEFAPLAHDKTPRVHEADLRSLVNYVLDTAIPGASLEPGTETADLTAAWEQTNLIPNPRTGAVVAPWNAYFSNGAGTIARIPSSGWSIEGEPANTRPRLDVTSTATSLVTFRYGASAADYIKGVRAGELYTLSAHVFQSMAGTKTGRLRVGFYDTAGKHIKSFTHNQAIPGGAVAEKLSMTCRAPAGASLAQIEIGVLNGITAGGYIGFIGAMFTADVENDRWFDGNRTAEPLYTYEWEGDTANDSPSRRIPVVERPLELFTWRAGVDAWSYLVPLLTAANLRLFCDESRRWYLINPATFERSGRITVTPAITVRGADTMDADSGLGGFTGCVAIYRWTDAAGLEQERIDAAGTAGRVKTLEFDAPYPGPGAALAHLTKLAGAGRSQAVVCANNYTVRPAQEVSVALPNTAAQVGRVRQVVFDLSPGALMTIETEGLIEATAGSWLEGAGGRTWSTTPDAHVWANQ